LVLPAAAIDTQPAARPAPPRVPVPDFAGRSACDVLRVGGDARIVVAQDGQEFALRLRGIYIPDGGGAREAAHGYLVRLLEGEAIHVELEPNAPARVGDEPAWAYVYRAPDGLFVNLELVRLGYARALSGDAGPHAAWLREYEEIARRQQKGLWEPPPAETPSPGAPLASQPAATQPAAKPRVARPASPPRGPIDPEGRVYITAHGRKYHRADCQHARNGATAIPLRDAKAQGYTPCARCKPPE
jgi:endonuclease YncB( thermonuclease family)